MRKLFIAFAAGILIPACSSEKEENMPVAENHLANTKASEEEVNPYDGTASRVQDHITAEEIDNTIVIYRNNLGHELRLEIMGQNHDHIWYYSEGGDEIQIIPMIGANEIYAMTTNEGTSLGNMHFKNIERETGADLPGEIEVDVTSGKSVFKRISIKN